MERKMREPMLPGTASQEPQPYEAVHRQVARRAAAEGIVLLKNEGQVLPLKKGSRIALYGAGASRTVKGGTGSGDVNERSRVSIYEGLKAAGYRITTEEWIADYDRQYIQAREAWREEVWRKCDASGIPEDGGLFDAYSATPFYAPAGSMPEGTDTDTAVFVLSRVAGENADRYNQEGDYRLSIREHELLTKVCSLYEHVIVLVNAGGLVELDFMDEFSNIQGLLFVVQPGMEGGNAVADVLSGAVVPSGKLTDTWALHYEDYPNSATFSHNNGNVEKELYEEGIYVGYRYFDTFDIPVRYCFGYGLSYTEFELQTIGIEHFNLGTAQPEIGVKVQVKNVGTAFSGREVVQVYVSCPQAELVKEYRRLAGFAKTKELAPGQMQELVIRFPLYQLASYSEKYPGWLLEAGRYGIYVGNSLESAQPAASFWMEDSVLMVKTCHICPVQEELHEKLPPVEKTLKKREAWEVLAIELPSLVIHGFDVQGEEIEYGGSGHRISAEAQEFVETLTQEQLIQLATGMIGQGSVFGAAGASVPGSAAQTSDCAMEQNLASIVLADGPAGLRLSPTYQVKDGRPLPASLDQAIENGYLCRSKAGQKEETRYQYCTAMPVGTLLAQTWDEELLREVGKAVAEEMVVFHVTLWLAPGMNIHRNPLCGRNFEYYSEDPFVAGKMAAAMTEGVQSMPGCGTTIKHFACNNQEDNRLHMDCVVSERALREIYLKGFEIAVKQAQPMSIMTSYNLVNGVHAANCYDLCTKAARDEWKFAGVIMTDWTTTHYGPDCTASGCMRAGNDLVMPGCAGDHENMRSELKNCTLTLAALKRSVARLAETVWKSNWYEKE